MPPSKNASLRYRVINACLTNPLKKYPTLEDILERISEQTGLSITPSQLYKDFAHLRENLDAPIEFNRYHKGYYYSQEGYSIDKLPLTSQEIEALDLSIALLQLLRGSSMLQQYENAINKVIEGYRISKTLGKSELEIIQIEQPVVNYDTKWLEILLKAIIEKKLLGVDYHRYNNPYSQHELSPYLLKEYRNRWYVIGYSSNRNSILVFALDRIENITEINGKYISDEEFSAVEFFKYSFGITQIHNVNPIKVVLCFMTEEAPYILSQPLHHSQKILSEGIDETVIELEVYNSPELKMAILSFGKGVRVISPNSLKDEIFQCICEMKEKYIEN